MNKADIVDVLEDIAVLLELKGENPFKIRAYSTGARALETMEEDVGELISGPCASRNTCESTEKQGPEEEADRLTPGPFAFAC